MPWNDPYRVAAKMALLDQQSGGRALLGFGRGLSRREYERLGIPMDEARGRFDQGTALVLQALEQGLLRGGHRVLPAAALRPAPAAHRRLRGSRLLDRRIAGVGRAGRGARRPAHGAWPSSPGRSSEQALEPYQEKWRSLRDSEPPVPFCGQLVYCDADPERARELGERYVKEYFTTVVEHYEIGGAHFKARQGYEFYGNAAEAIQAMGLEKMADMYASVNTFGTPAQIVEQLRAQKQVLGVDHDVLVIPKYGSMTRSRPWPRWRSSRAR